MPESATHLGALTTPFTPPPACATQSVEVSAPAGNPDRSLYFLAWGQTCTLVSRTSQSGAIVTSCHPSGYGAFYASRAGLPGYGYYSPGVGGCPVGQVSACTVTRRAGEGPPGLVGESGTVPAEIWSRLGVGETAVGCCLSGYECDPEYSYRCTSIIPGGEIFVGTSYVDSCSPTISTMSIPSSTTGFAVGYRINLVIPASTTLPSNSTPDSGVPENSGNELAPSGGGGLSTGAKIAIGVVVPLVVIAAAAAILFLWRRRHQAKDGTAAAGAPVGDAWTKAELDGNGRPVLGGGVGHPLELSAAGRDPVAVAELDTSVGRERLVELPGAGPHELPGNRYAGG